MNQSYYLVTFNDNMYLGFCFLFSLVTVLTTLFLNFICDYFNFDYWISDCVVGSRLHYFEESYQSLENPQEKLKLNTSLVRQGDCWIIREGNTGFLCLPRKRIRRSQVSCDYIPHSTLSPHARKSEK